MPSLSSAATQVVATESSSSTSSGTSSATSTGYIYSYATSKIVRTAVAAGVIVLVLTALVLFFKISSWIRVNQRLRRQRDLNMSLKSEQHANAYEIAAWSDEPSHVPVRGILGRRGKNKKTWKEKREEIKAMKRGGANAWAVQEWEGVAA